MTWISNILGNENKSSLSDKEYALEFINTSKEDIKMLSKCITEASNAELRKILTNQLNTSINDYFKLSDLANQKGFYNAFAAPSSQIQQDIQEAKNLQNPQ